MNPCHDTEASVIEVLVEVANHFRKMDALNPDLELLQLDVVPKSHIPTHPVHRLPLIAPFSTLRTGNL